MIGEIKSVCKYVFSATKTQYRHSVKLKIIFGSDNQLRASHILVFGWYMCYKRLAPHSPQVSLQKIDFELNVYDCHAIRLSESLLLMDFTALPKDLP